MRHPLEAIIEMIDSLVGMLLKHIKEIISSNIQMKPKILQL